MNRFFLISKRLILWVSCSLIAAFTHAQGFIPHQLLAPQQGIDFGNGVAVADYNRDGFPDIYIVSMQPFDKSYPKSWNRLLKGTAAGFVDATISAKLSDQYAGATLGGENGVKTGASWGDFDNDGYPDLFLTNQGKDQLYHNKGDGTFEEVTEMAGIADCGACYSTSALWWDYDQDGFLDIYVNDWTIKNRLYHNNQNGTFTDLSQLSGLDDEGNSFTSLPFDIDKDGDPDLYVVNDFGPNTFYLNNGDGTFTEQTIERGLSDPGEGMGVDLCDCNHDGNFDIYLTNIWKNHSNPFFVAGEGNLYSDQAQGYNLGDAGWGWGIRFFDMDHDMDEDIYLVNQLKWLDNTPDFNRLFVAEQGRFRESAHQFGVDAFEEGHGLEVFDYNDDGDLDLIVTNWGAPVILYQNEIPNKGNWLKISLEGTSSNRNAFGTVIKVKTGDQLQHRLHHGANFLGQSIKPLHVGLAHYDTVEELTVFWPGGRVEKLHQVAANQTLYLKEGDRPSIEGEYYGNLIDSLDHTEAKDSTDQNEKVPEAFKVSIYPNPLAGHSVFEFEMPKAGPVDLAIVNAQGIVVYQTGFYMEEGIVQKEWPRSLLSHSGILFCQITAFGQKFIQRVVKL